MPYSFCLLTATWLAGAPQAPAPTVQGQPGAVLGRPVTTAPVLTPVPVTVPEPPARGWRLGDRLRGLFGRRSSEMPTLNEPPLTQISNKQMVVTPQGALQQAPPGPGNEQYPLSAKELDKVGHEKDHSWLTGKLFRAGNRWVLRYGAPYEVDRYGGAVELSAHPELAKLRAGDLVCVHGRVVQTGRTAGSPGAIYQVEAFSLIERPNGR
jgi:hypothetical protein